MTEQREIITAFSEMAPRYESLMNNELNRFWGINYKEFVARLLSDVFTNPDELILDIATGTAYIPAFLLGKKMKFRRIIGLDLTFGMLFNAKEKLEEKGFQDKTRLVCASAHQMPFQLGSFDQAICCLATHHMDVSTLLENIDSALKQNGSIYLADAGASSGWKNLFIRFLIKSAAFVYFLFTENFPRAIAESSAIGNIHTVSEWEKLLKDNGFIEIRIQNLKSKKFWAPDPIIIKAKKNQRRNNDINSRSH